MVAPSTLRCPGRWHGGVGNPYDGGISGGSLGVYHAFIQFAGFTMGKTISQFDAPWVNYPGNNFDGLVGGSGTVTGVNQFTYTAQFGNGVSGTLCLVDPTAYNQSNLFNRVLASSLLSAFGTGGFGLNDLGGTRAPDLIGRIKVDQAWGMFQFRLSRTTTTLPTTAGPSLTVIPTTSGAGLFRAALQFKNIPTGAGDTINLQAVYTDGATRYNLQSLVPQTSRCSVAPACRAPTRALASLPRLTVSS